MEDNQTIRICANCLHFGKDENNESQCEISREMYTCRCKVFAPKNAKIEKSYAKEIINNSISTPLIYIGLTMLVLAILVCFIAGFKTAEDHTLQAMIAAGILCLTIAAISRYIYRSRRKDMGNDVRQEVENKVRRELLPKLLTKEAINEYLTKHNYLPEPTPGNKGIIFTYNEVHFAIYFDEVNRVVIRYSNTVESKDIPTIKKILDSRDCANFATDMWLQEYTDDDGTSRYTLECTACFFVVHVDNFERVFPIYLSNLETAAGHFLYTLDQYKNSKDVQYGAEMPQRRDNIYNPEYRWFPHIMKEVCASKIAMEALTDEEWLRTAVQSMCNDDAIRNEWREFKIKRVDNYGDYKLIVYQFPKPKVAPEAKYGIIMLNKQALEASYYTLEMSLNDGWFYGGVAEDRHLNYGSAESADLDKFIEWIFSSNKQVVTSTNYKKE